MVMAYFRLKTWRCNMENWNELDEAAAKNLTPVGLKVFHEYKEQLRCDGHKWENDAYDILRGYIWDESEEP
jgi:hypothetical protein